MRCVRLAVLLAIPGTHASYEISYCLFTQHYPESKLAYDHQVYFALRSSSVSSLAQYERPCNVYSRYQRRHIATKLNCRTWTAKQAYRRCEGLVSDLHRSQAFFLTLRSSPAMPIPNSWVHACCRLSTKAAMRARASLGAASTGKVRWAHAAK